MGLNPPLLSIRYGCVVLGGTDGGKAYDSHCNLVLGDVEETIYIVSDDSDDDSVKVCTELELGLNVPKTRQRLIWDVYE